MTQQAAVVKAPKTVSLWQFLLIMILGVGIFVGAGFLVGKQFFWVDAEKMQAKKELGYYQGLVKAKPEDVENRVALGYRYFVLGEYANAIPHLRAAIELDNNYYDAYLNLGYVYFAMGNYDEALENFEKLTMLAPTDYKGWLNFGITQYELGEYNEALESLETAKSFNRAAVDVIYHLGVAYELSGDIETAIEVYEEALQFDPSYEDAKNSLKRLTRG